MAKFVDKIIIAGNVSTPFLEAKNYSRMNWSRIPKDYQLKIFHRQPAATIIKMCFTSKNTLETAEEALSEMPDVVLLRKLIKFFEENYSNVLVGNNLLTVHIERHFIIPHHYRFTFQYEAARKLFVPSMACWRQLYEKLNRELKGEFDERRNILKTIATETHAIQTKWEQENRRGPKSIQLAAIPDHIVIELFKKSSLAVLSRLWRTCRRVKSIAVIYTTTTRILSWFFMIPNAKPRFAGSEYRRRQLWDWFLLDATIMCLRHCKHQYDMLPIYVKQDIKKFLSGGDPLLISNWYIKQIQSKPTYFEWHRWGHCPIRLPFRRIYANPRKRLFVKPIMP